MDNYTVFKKGDLIFFPISAPI